MKEKSELVQFIDKGFEACRTRNWLGEEEFDRAFDLAGKPDYFGGPCKNCKEHERSIYDTGFCGLCVGWILENLYFAY